MKLPLLPVEQHAQNTPTCIHWVDIMVPVYVDFFHTHLNVINLQRYMKVMNLKRYNHV